VKSKGESLSPFSSRVRSSRSKNNEENNIIDNHFIDANILSIEIENGNTTFNNINNSSLNQNYTGNSSYNMTGNNSLSNTSNNLNNTNNNISINKNTNNTHCFKKAKWTSKFRTKEGKDKTISNLTKNIEMKNLKIIKKANRRNTNNVDEAPVENPNLQCKLELVNIFKFIDESLEVGPSVIPSKKYCDITGLESKYTDPISKLRFYSSDMYKLSKTLNESIKNQYLSLRNALFIIK